MAAINRLLEASRRPPPPPPPPAPPAAPPAAAAADKNHRPAGTLHRPAGAAPACAQMLRWVWGHDAHTGQKVRWMGLVKRRNATAEICAEWGRDGHFSAGV